MKFVFKNDKYTKFFHEVSALKRFLNTVGTLTDCTDFELYQLYVNFSQHYYLNNKTNFIYFNNETITEAEKILENRNTFESSDNDFNSFIYNSNVLVDFVDYLYNLSNNAQEQNKSDNDIV